MRNDVDTILRDLRVDIINMAQRSSHVAVALSCIDILAALYFEVLNVAAENPLAPERDLFILSKGHGCMALYAILSKTGFIDPESLESYVRNGSPLAEHPLAGKVPGIEVATGALGHGLAVAAGMAKSLKLQRKHSRVFVLLGDGECDEGSVWEAAAIAASHCLDNLTAIVDWNGLQACGRCEEISRGISLPDCWKAFGWDVDIVDGHDYLQLKETFQRASVAGKPRVVFCRTVKGKGIDFMENNLEWHYRPVQEDDRVQALRVLSDA